jgi:Ca2+-binding EF-hand superfamily protein
MRQVRAIGLGFGLALLAGVGSSSSALAQQGGGINFIELFSQLDANNDKVIEKSEVPESGRAAFAVLLKHADKNNDGKIDRDEYRDVLVSLREAGPGQGQGAGPGAGAGPNPFVQMDRNGDGKLSREELAVPEVLFNRIDADKDGLITTAEAARFREETGAGPGLGIMLFRGLKEMDKNGDGKVSREEFTGPEPQFDRIDADKDGFITQEEAARMILRGGLNQGFAAPRLQEMDTNNDGKISRKEWTGPEPQFDRIDADKDGFITPAEVRQFFAPNMPATKKASEATEKEKDKEKEKAKDSPDAAGK